MCVAPVMIAATLASTAVSAYSSVQQGNYQKDVSRYNARVGENEATRTRNAGNEAEMRARQETAQLLSRQRAQLAANNVEIDSGSALQLQEDTRMQGEVDALRIRSNFGDQARTMDDQATLTRSQGNMAKRAGNLSAGSSILSGVGAVTAGVDPRWYSSTSAATGASANSSFGSIA